MAVRNGPSRPSPMVKLPLTVKVWGVVEAPKVIVGVVAPAGSKVKELYEPAISISEAPVPVKTVVLEEAEKVPPSMHNGLVLAWESSQSPVPDPVKVRVSEAPV